MAVTEVSTTLRNSAADLFADAIDAGGGAGTITICDSGDVTLVVLTFSGTAYGSASSGTCTANAITGGTAVASGTPSYAIISTSAATALWKASVGTSGENINLSSASIVSGNSVELSGLDLVYPSGS